MLQQGLLLYAFLVVAAGLFFALDDLYIDVLSWFYRIKPHRLNDMDHQRMNHKTQKRIAIMIANWREEAVLERMVAGNTERIKYGNYVIYLGVYPNDPATYEIALRLEQQFEHVKVIVNSKLGPTTKGQMLNEMVRAILDLEKSTGKSHDLFLLQDSEDVLDPDALKLINDAADGSDFVQIPVFSFSVPWNQLVAGTYMDEFSEAHCKDLMVRARVGASIPSAGVGTALSRRLVLHNINKSGGFLLREDTLTEDYDLGMKAKAAGFQSRFVCAYRPGREGEYDFIATREYFPSRFKASVRQRGRWTLGIVFQGWANLGWQGSLKEKYFIFRDRRSVLNAFLLALGLVFLLVLPMFCYFQQCLPEELSSAEFKGLAAVNLLNMAYRMGRRMQFVGMVHSWREVWSVPLRWWVGNIINMCAASHAFILQMRAWWTGSFPVWQKTLHVLPKHFGSCALTAINKNKASNSNTVLGLVLLLLLASTAPTEVSAAATDAPCVNIYYDQPNDPSYWMGRTYSIMVQNLLGHFPDFQQRVGEIRNYRSGDIEKCKATIYIGSYFDSEIPPAFLRDFKMTEKRVAWLGYNVWKYPPEEQDHIFGAHYKGLTVLDKKNLVKQQPSFFKNIHYKGEVFYKYGKFTKANPSEFLAPFEMAIMQKAQDGETVAEAEQNATGERLPYILRKRNKFYVADVPLSFAHEADRYLIFADVLFDILGASPRHNGKYAFVRIEDVHPMMPLPYLYSVTRALTAEHVPLHLSLIPIFYDPLNEFGREDRDEFRTMTQVPEFMQFLREAQALGAGLIWHGSTHQLGTKRNPHTAVSGDDFEFWDAVKGRPLEQDSPEFVFDRLDAGFYDLKKAGVYPNMWLTPHYQASPLDYLIFARVFPWNVGRVIYHNFSLPNPLETVDERLLWYSKENSGKKAEEFRKRYFVSLKVTIDSERWSGQLFPYEIYGDVFGQRLLPENLGNSQPVENAHVVQPRSVQEILADAKRNLVLRDVWASFFYHPQLLNTDENGGRGRYPGDPAELVYLIKELKKLGYTFIQAGKFAEENKKFLRPEPIYLIKENQR